MNKKLKLTFIYLSSVLGALILFIIGYVLFVVFSYERIPNNVDLTVDGQRCQNIVNVNEELTISSYNIGFGAYSQDYTFFLDYGETNNGESTNGLSGKAKNKEEVLFNTYGAIETITSLNPDFALFQEVDIKATRSYKVNQYEMLKDGFLNNSHTFGINFNSAFLPYPINDMHGRTLSGIATFSKYQILESCRISLPIATDFSKFFDLDRCFVINEFNTSNDNKLIIVNIHMSAYDEGGVIRKQQLDLLNNYLDECKEKGYYVIIGGDFNHDLITYNPMYNYNFDTNIAFKEFINHKRPDWLQLFFNELNESVITNGYKVIASDNAPTCRDASIEWEIGKGYITTIDGFIVSDNIKVLSVETIVTENGNKGLKHFAYSDHDPVLLKFILSE